jgi:hypothetical protein
MILPGQINADIVVDPKPVCEIFGIGWEAQRAKLVNAAAEGGWAVVTKIVMTGKDGKIYEQTFITLETFLVWLATISIDRVDEKYKDKLRTDQREAGVALRKAFFRRTLSGPTCSTPVNWIAEQPCLSEPPFLDTSEPVIFRHMCENC